MSGRLSTHVLDLARGVPAAGLDLSLYALGEQGQRALVRTATTNADGRVDGPLLEGAAMAAGCYELVFQVGAYHQAQAVPLPAGPFLAEVPLRFVIADPAAHYHVPLLLSPYGYSTYRGS